jgi:hypothetical protein
VIHDENARGSAPNPAGAPPLRPALKSKPFQERKTKPCRPSRWSVFGHQQLQEKILAQTGGDRLEQLQVLSAAHLAGFEVITHGRICGDHRGTFQVEILRCASPGTGMLTNSLRQATSCASLVVVFPVAVPIARRNDAPRLRRTEGTESKGKKRRVTEGVAVHGVRDREI